MERKFSQLDQSLGCINSIQSSEIFENIIVRVEIDLMTFEMACSFTHSDCLVDDTPLRQYFM